MAESFSWPGYQIAGQVFNITNGAVPRGQGGTDGGASSWHPPG